MSKLAQNLKIQQQFTFSLTSFGYQQTSSQQPILDLMYLNHSGRQDEIT